MPTPTPPSKDTTQHDAAQSPLSGATAVNAGQTLIQAPGSQFAAFLSAPMAPEELGRLGGFRILRLVGQGGMGFVFEGEDLKLHRRVAIKVMRPEVAQHPDAVNRFLREARTAAALVSDYVVTIHHVDEQNGVPFLVMPLMAGESLHERMHREPISLEDGIRIARQCAQGLAAAHAADLIHRDIKPANLWLEAPSGRVKILDFGLARGASRSDITRSGEVLGTPQYMSPEQARGKGIDARADLFSLGAVMYRLATGREAFSGDDILAVLSSLAVDDPTPPREVNPKVPAALSDLIMRLLDKDAARRPARAQEVVDALRSIESGESKTVAESASSTPSHLLPSSGSMPGPRRRWAIAIPAAAVVGVALALLARNAFHSNPPSDSAPKTEVAELKKQPAPEEPRVEPKPSPPPVVEKPAAKPSPPVEKPKEEPPPPPPPQPSLFRLNPLAPVTIEAGKSIDYSIEIDRENLPGEVTLTQSELPAGVTLEPRGFAPGETKLSAKLTASTGAKPGTAIATIIASAGSATARREFPITILAPIVPKLLVSLPASVKLKTGTMTPLVVSIEREHIEGAARLQWLDLPAGIRAGGATLIPSTGGKTQVTLSADYSARAKGTARIRATFGDLSHEQRIDIEVERVAPAGLDSTKSAVDAADVKVIQQNWADYLGKPLIETMQMAEGLRIEFVLIPPGEFWMGSPPDDADAYPDEQPRHKRKVLKPFYLGRTPVTIEQYTQFVRATNYKTDAESTGKGGSGYMKEAHEMVLRNPRFSWRNNGFEEFGDHPVVNLTAADAVRFCEWFSTRQNIGKAILPSEAQWEYAARAGGTTRYIAGDDPMSLDEHGNVADQTLKDLKLKGAERWKYFEFKDGAAFTTPVGHFKGNNFGLRDMTGNVWQWCADSFDASLYRKPPPDERVWRLRDAKEQIVRGGSWNTNPRESRLACRDRNEVDDRQSIVGFRVAIVFE